VKNALHILDPQ